MADIDLARKLAAHPRWRWAIRMGAVVEGRIGLQSTRQTVTVLAVDDDGRGYDTSGCLPADAVPDLDDAATAGILLGMLVAAMPLRTVVVVREMGGPNSGMWWAELWLGTTAGEALARALLAAWERSDG